jgi:hypothetical protein
MITVNYRLIKSPFLGGEALVITGVEGTYADSAAVRLEGIKSAVLRLGDNAYRVNDSIAKIPLGSIPEGVITPLAEVGKRTVPMAPLLKDSSGIFPAPLGGEECAKILSLCLSLEERIALTEARIAELQDSVKGHSIFNFIEEKKG